MKSSPIEIFFFSPVFMFLSSALPLSSSLSPSTIVYGARILSAYFIWALRPRAHRSQSAATPQRCSAFTSWKAFTCAASPIAAMYSSHLPSSGNSAPNSSSASMMRSKPRPKPSAGVGLPPISSTRPS